jgi:hypothetical protein
MTQKDYILIAAALRKSAEHAAELSAQQGIPAYVSTSDYTILQVCDALEAQHNTNPYPFKRSVFLSAAGHSNPAAS